MEVRKETTSEFYGTLSDWWSKHSILHEGKRISYPQIPLAILPQNTFVVSDDEYDLYSLCFYHTDSAMSWLAYPTSNLDAPKENREGALVFLMNEVEKYAREQNYFLMFTTSPVKPVQDSLLESGFVEGDMKTSQFYKKLPPISQQNKKAL